MVAKVRRILGRVNRRKGALLYGLVASVTVVFIASAGRSHSTGFRSVGVMPAQAHSHTARTVMPNGLAFTGQLSQTMFTQASDGRVYLNLAVAVPEQPCEGSACGARRATDTIIILDRSGSMSADNRLPFAKRAIHALIDRLQPLDRLAVVAFDSSAEVISPLSFLSENSKSALHAKVDALAPGSGTNISQGMQLGGDLLLPSAGERAQKVILLSDGEANEGIIDPQQLARMASSVNRRAASFSTIGMGLGFNEQLMANLADWGGGSFSYLEHLEALGTILDKNLKDARRLYASISSIEMRLPEHVRLIDAAGYPFEKTADGFAIPFGELLAGSKKSATLTLEFPTDSIRTHSLGAISMRFKDSSGEHIVGLPSDIMKVAIVEHHRKAEVTASINKDLYRQSWLTNNLGLLKQSVQKGLSRGDTAGAAVSIASYEKQLQNAADAAGVDLASPEVKAQISQMRGELSEASKGSGVEQQEKQNRLRKKYLYDGQSYQRSFNY